MDKDEIIKELAEENAKLKGELQAVPSFSMFWMRETPSQTNRIQDKRR